MKKSLILICVIILVAMLLMLTRFTNMENENTNKENEITNIEIENSNNSSMSSDFNELVLDYNDASAFENALNSGEKVNEKTVKFDVKNYEPNSAMGINCWSGEHLNFISDNGLDVKTGDIIIGRVKEEPTSFLGSWKIKYDVIEIQHNEQENEEEENISVENVENQNQNNNSIDDNKIIENTESNSTNITKESESNQETNQIKYNYYTTNDNETAEKGNTGKYSYVKRNGSYKVYWIIDFDNGYVYDFTEGNGDDTCEKIKIQSGNLNDGLRLSYKDSNNAWAKYIHFKYKNQPHQLVIVDNDYFEYDYSTTSLEDALELMENKTIWEP